MSKLEESISCTPLVNELRRNPIEDNNNNNKLQIYIAQFPWRDDQLRITTIHGIN